MVFCVTIASSAEAKSKNRHKSNKSDQTASSESKSKKDKGKRDKAKSKKDKAKQEQEKDAEPDVIVNQAIDDPCYTLQTNERWRQLFADFSTAYQEKKFDTALELTEQLKTICEASPILNYSIGMTHREMGNNKEALRHYKQAIENTKKFGVSEELLTKFWFARYEMENAEVICKQVDLDACNAKSTQLESDLNKANTKIQNLNDAIQNDVHRRDAIVMWTGAGIGIAGLAAVGAGAALLATADKSVTIEPPQQDEQKVKGKIHTGEITGYAVLGAGIGLTVAGAVMAGIGGYNYTHPITEDVTASWNITPSNIEFGLKF